MELIDRIKESKLVPVIALQNAQDAAPLCGALAEGGLRVAEITFRTAAAPEALRLVKQAYPDFLLGAGTVTLMEEVERAAASGAAFAVAPGFNPRIVNRAKELGLPFYPGVCTPTEVEAALELGCQTLKFFPAGTMGGLKMIGDLFNVYKHRGVRFMVTGGINQSNVAEYVRHPAVLACGGTWFVTADLIAAGNWHEITRLTREALAMLG